MQMMADDIWDLFFVYATNICVTLVFLFFVRIYIVYLRIHNPKRTVSRAESPTAKLMIVVGSGGHTFEMLRLLRYVRKTYRPRIYVLADTDEMSQEKVLEFEQNNEKDTFIFAKIPRSREVHQSWISTIFTTAYSFFYAVPLIMKHKPNAILCNGPGTCVPLCIASYLLHVLGLKQTTVIYIESICRVYTMSLSGKILYYIADYFLVQWPQLKEKYPRAKYLGHLV